MTIPVYPPVWKTKEQEHLNRAASLRVEAEKLLNAAKSEDTAASVCRINAKRESNFRRFTS